MKKYLIIADATGKNEPSIQRGIELAKLSGAAVYIVGFAYDIFVPEHKERKNSYRFSTGSDRR